MHVTRGLCGALFLLAAACDGTAVVTQSDAMDVEDQALFSKRTIEGVGAGTWPIGAGDFDEDGRLDLAVATKDEGQVVLLLGRRGGSPFAVAGRFWVGQGPRSSAVADFDQDGHLDIAVGNSDDSTISILRGFGDGTMDGAQLIDTASNGSRIGGLARVQLDDDGIDDLAASLIDPQQLVLYQGIGDATFTEVGRLPMGELPLQVSSADVDGDGFPEILVTNQGDNFEDGRNGSVSIVRRGLQGFTVQTVPVGGTPRNVAVGDYDRDGIADLAVANYFPSVVSVHLGERSGGYHLGPVIDMGRVPGETWGNHPQAILTTDLNRDGVLDLVVTTVENDLVTQLTGNRDGTFRVARRISVGVTPVGLVSGRFNNNALPDVAVTHMRSASVTVLVDLGN